MAANWNGALLPWPLNANNPNPANNPVNGAAVAGAAGAPGAPPFLGLVPPIVNPVPRLAAVAGARLRRSSRVMTRGSLHARRQSETSTAREHDEIGEGLRTNLGEELADRFARFKSNQHLAHSVMRTGIVNLKRAAVLADEQEQKEKTLIDRYGTCIETDDVVEGDATALAEADLLQQLREWSDRVRQEREQNAETRAYLEARRADLLKKQESLTTACRYIDEAATTITLPPAPKFCARFK